MKPFEWKFDEGRLTEIPVTTMPLFKVPIHASYVLYLAEYSELLAKAYWKSALAMCRMFKVGPSLLLHPLDFMGKDDDSDLAFFPAMGSPGERKIELTAWMIDQMATGYDIRPMKDHAEALFPKATKSASAAQCCTPELAVTVGP